MSRVRTVGEIFSFLQQRKKYWLAPLILLLAFFGLLIAAGEASGLGPFVYPFF